MQVFPGRLFQFDRGSLALAAALGLLVFGGCATSDEGTFDPGTGAGGGAPTTDAGGTTDAKSDAKEGGSALCDLAKCPTPPGGAQKCCAGVSICGYMGGSICYPLKDGGAGGAGGSSP